MAVPPYEFSNGFKKLLLCEVTDILTLIRLSLTAEPSKADYIDAVLSLATRAITPNVYKIINFCRQRNNEILEIFPRHQGKGQFGSLAIRHDRAA